jgi:hypothetical protein
VEGPPNPRAERHVAGADDATAERSAAEAAPNGGGADAPADAAGAHASTADAPTVKAATAAHSRIHCGRYRHRAGEGGGC